MPLDILHNVEKSVYQLLNAPKDIQGGTPVSDFTGSMADADPKLRKFFSLYIDDLPNLYSHCERWWRGCVAAAEHETRTREEAIQTAFYWRLAGPASAPEFIWFIRESWLYCDRINKKLPLEHRVAPEVVLLKWLVDAGEQDYVTLVTCMPYWPIGLDEHGEWS
jgi:hypothetical protein